MKSSPLKLFLAVGLSLAALVASEAKAGHPIYPPFSSHDGKFLIFPDSDNDELMNNCTPSHRVCARFYILPPAYKLKTNEETGAKMLTQGIFPGRSRLDHKVIYNLTLEPDLSDLEEAKEYLLDEHVEDEFGRRSRSFRSDQVIVSALPAARLQIVSTGLPHANRDGGPTRDKKPPRDLRDIVESEDDDAGLSKEEVEEVAESIARNVTFTKFYAPNLSGDIRSLAQPFSISIQGNIWDLEPGMQNMFLSEGGNAAIGTVSFQFRALARSLDVTMKCDLKTFQEVVNSTRKKWHIVRYRSRNYSYEKFNNDEWNAIRSNLKVDDYCQIEQYKDTTVRADQFIDKMQDLIFKRLLERAFKTVIDRSQPQTQEGDDPKYTYYESKAIDTAEATIDFDVTSEQVIWLSSDIDFTAGAVDEENLSPIHWTLCNHWERPNPTTRSCEAICEPYLEVYWRGHPKAQVPQFGPLDVPACVLYTDLHGSDEGEE